MKKKEWDGTRAAAIVGKNGRSLRNEDLSDIRVYLTNVRPVIESRIFIAVQQRMEENQALASDNSPNNNLKELSGLLKCANCGSAIKMQKSPTITCTGRSQRKICDVSFKGLRIETVQHNVAIEVNKYLENLHMSLNEKQKKRTKIRIEIDKLEKQLDRLIDLGQQSKDLEERLVTRINNLVMEIKKREVKLQAYDMKDIIELRLEPNESLMSKPLYDRNGKLLLDYGSLDIEYKQSILRLLVRKINLYSDGNVEIIWKDI